MIKNISPATELDTADHIEKILLELQCVLRENTKTPYKENAYVMLASTVQLYTMVSKKCVADKRSFLYNAALAWDNMNEEDLQEVTYQ